MEEENKELEKYNSEDITTGEIPGTAEQLKQFYNSEQWETIRETIISVGETLIEAVKPVIERVNKAVKEIHRGLMITFSTDPEIKKCYRIYKRTKNRRIRKKQMTRINKIIGRYIKNGSMDKDAG